MAKELTGVTNGVFTLEETNVENQFYFFQNNHEVLMNVGTLPIEMYARYLIYKVKEGQIKEDYDVELSFELSNDKKVLRLTASESVTQPLHIVKNNESTAPKVTEPNFFKRVFSTWFGE